MALIRTNVASGGAGIDLAIGHGTTYTTIIDKLGHTVRASSGTYQMEGATVSVTSNGKFSLNVGCTVFDGIDATNPNQLYTLPGTHYAANAEITITAGASVIFD